MRWHFHGGVELNVHKTISSDFSDLGRQWLPPWFLFSWPINHVVAMEVELDEIIWCASFAIWDGNFHGLVSFLGLECEKWKGPLIFLVVHYWVYSLHTNCNHISIVIKRLGNQVGPKCLVSLALTLLYYNILRHFEDKRRMVESWGHLYLKLEMNLRAKIFVLLKCNYRIVAYQGFVERNNREFYFLRIKIQP